MTSLWAQSSAQPIDSKPLQTPSQSEVGVYDIKCAACGRPVYTRLMVINDRGDDPS